MIRPRKYMRLSQCPLRVAAVLLEELQEYFALPIPNVEPLIQRRLGDEASANIPLALDVLFLIGLVEYNEPSDCLHYLPSGDGDFE